MIENIIISILSIDFILRHYKSITLYFTLFKIWLLCPSINLNANDNGHVTKELVNKYDDL